MKIAKKVLAVAIAVGMIFCLAAMAFATGSTTLSATVADGVVTLTVANSDAEGLTAFDSAITYDAAVLKVKGAVKDGAYKAQYEACGESIISAYNTNEAGTILPGVAIGNQIYDDATFAGMCEDNEVEGTPVSTKGMTICTVKFTVVDDAATSTTINCGSASVTVTLKEAAPETTTEAPAAETTTAPAAADETTAPAAADETTTAKVDEPTTAPAAETTTATPAGAAADQPAKGDKKPAGTAAHGTANTGDTAVLAVAAGVCALAAAAYVVTKKVK